MSFIIHNHNIAFLNVDKKVLVFVLKIVIRNYWPNENYNRVIVDTWYYYTTTFKIRNISHWQLPSY